MVIVSDNGRIVYDQKAGKITIHANKPLTKKEIENARKSAGT